MTLLRIVVAVAVSLCLIYLAGANSMGRPEFLSHSENGFTFEMTTVPKAWESSDVEIPVTISGPIEPDLKLLFRHSVYGQNDSTDMRRYERVPLSVEDSAAGKYFTTMSTGARGLKLYYFFEIRDAVGGYRASFKQPDGKPFVIKYVGEVPRFVLISHIVLMTATVLFVTLGSLYSFSLIRGSLNARPMSLCFLGAALATFLGGYLFGFAMNHYTFGTVWEGVPFGTDATDNKTQLIFITLLFVTLAGIGSLSKGRVGRDIYPVRLYGWLGLAAFAVVVMMFFIPHSIQFSPSLTRAVCYGYIGAIALIFGAGWWHLLSRGRRVAKTAKSTSHQ